MPGHAEAIPADGAAASRAAGILRAGGLVAFPTETVYGLGADAASDAAVTRIFEAKGRPRVNPLIAHVGGIAEARELVEWPDSADALARAFWPGPLTLVLPLLADSGISSLATAGLPTLAVRAPAHPLARRILEAFGGPVAAPSANRSGRISPTAAAHVVAELGDRIDAVIDGGSCDVGLESTIVRLDGAPALLRPGGIPEAEVAAALGRPLARGGGGRIDSPGQMASHYAPEAALRLNARDRKPGEALLGFGPMECDLNLSAAGDLREAAANLFTHLRALDAANSAIAVAPIPDSGIGAAVNDRLRRAAAPG